MKYSAHSLILDWRSVCRSLWNETYLRAIGEGCGSFRLEQNFCEIERLLWDSVVLQRLDGEVRDCDRIGSHMVSPLRSIPRFRIVPRGKAPMPTRINREIDSGYWDYPLKELALSDALVCFSHCFDFAGMDQPRRYEYFCGEIIQSSRYPEIVGKQILVPVDLSWIEESNEAEP